ncbi:hypothetical protein EVG20_g11361 [Dentipellis fragilis]|uniref:Uncharacterized protein n=1 Tax=Dentipellis fragilis TaxID=205917 RepID=A0A4Y9XQD1_9AGAM|nr:hypothetical protein EVG20_g11361 [Dentipellis fragilis]
MPDSAPPAYDSNPPPQVDPRPVGLPTVFRIGSQTLEEPIVQPKHVKCHLNLLRAFHELREKVEAGTDTRIPPSVRPMEKDQRWAWFVGLAVERFDRWTKCIRTRASESTVEWLRREGPPIDVWMVWHAYLLNPRSYAEDCTRFLKRFGDMPPGLFLDALGEIGDITSFVPSSLRSAAWSSKTKTPYDPFDALGSLTDYELTCPSCAADIRAPYINESGTGYAQQNFSFVCACKFEITREKLALLKFTNDLALDHHDSITVLKHGKAVYLPMTLRTAESSEDRYRANAIKDLLLLSRPFKPKTTKAKGKVMKTPFEMAESVNWSMSQTRTIPLRAKNPRIVSRILTAYSDLRPYSVELSGAVLRQATFVKKMYDLGWTEPNFFDDPEDEVALSHAIVRYHAFLDLMSSSPSSFFVPTLDIDLVWHTHQLQAADYQRECKKYTGRYIDHDDKVEETHLSNAFDLTCRAWNARFHVPYMHCGCPLPGDTVGQKLSRLVTHMGMKYNPKIPVPPEHPAMLAATHPSDHNSIVVPDLPHQDAHRRQRERKIERRRQRDAELVRQGRMRQDVYDRGASHNAAFLVRCRCIGAEWVGASLAPEIL